MILSNVLHLKKINSMGKELERRNFLGKLTLGLSSLAVLPLFGWGKNTEKNMEEIKTIKKNTCTWFSMGNIRSVFILCTS